MIRASVAMAVRNGGQYLPEQLESILNMMSEDDELVISYDVSFDNSWEIVNHFAKNDSRISIHINSSPGLEENFNNAVMHCRGRFIFLADQDDVWINNKINSMISFLKLHKDTGVVICNGYITNSYLQVEDELFHHYHATANPIRNLIKGTYLGCQMMFTNEVKDAIWPVPLSPRMPHDLWTGVCASYFSRVRLLNKKLILHRIHDGNYTHGSKLTVFSAIRNRYSFVKSLLRQQGKLL